ncbi:MAG: endonuclease [Prolixibacteraceae bacterium]|nr:endonuclease [Prolixibacteraceae bacterium]
MLTRIILFFFTLITLLPAQAQNRQVATVMFYNVENLFDTEDNPDTLDDEFLPDGLRRWSNYRFVAKLNSLAKVISNTGNWEPPAVIGLCEIENSYVLERLVNQPGLKKWNYKIVHKDSPDIRGIDVAALYRSDLFSPIAYHYFPPEAQGKPIPATREILCLSGVVAETDTIHVFFNHWPSRYGGLMETRDARKNAAERLKSEIANLQAQYVNPAIIIMGDFNDQPDDDSMMKHLGASIGPVQDPENLVNLSHKWMEQKKGTLKYQSMWYLFDQIIVSESLFERELHCSAEDAYILEAPFLFENDEQYTGKKPFRTYNGMKYNGGYSDHLPILLKLWKNE